MSSSREWHVLAFQLEGPDLLVLSFHVQYLAVASLKEEIISITRQEAAEMLHMPFP